MNQATMRSLVATNFLLCSLFLGTKGDECFNECLSSAESELKSLRAQFAVAYVNLTAAELDAACVQSAQLDTCVRNCSSSNQVLNHAIVAQSIRFICDRRKEYPKLNSCYTNLYKVDHTVQQMGVFMLCGTLDPEMARVFAANRTHVNRTRLLSNFCPMVESQLKCEEKRINVDCVAAIVEGARVYRSQFLSQLLESTIQKLDFLQEASKEEECQQARAYLEASANPTTTPFTTTHSTSTAEEDRTMREPSGGGLRTEKCKATLFFLVLVVIFWQQ